MRRKIADGQGDVLDEEEAEDENEYEKCVSELKRRVEERCEKKEPTYCKVINGQNKKHAQKVGRPRTSDDI